MVETSESIGRQISSPAYENIGLTQVQKYHDQLIEIYITRMHATRTNSTANS